MKKIVINIAMVFSFAFATMSVHADYLISEGDDCVESGSGKAVRSGYEEHSRSCDSGTSMPASPKQPAASMTASPKQLDSNSWDGHGSSGHAASYRPAGIAK